MHCSATESPLARDSSRDVPSIDKTDDGAGNGAIFFFQQLELIIVASFMKCVNALCYNLTHANIVSRGFAVLPGGSTPVFHFIFSYFF